MEERRSQQERQHARDKPLKTAESEAAPSRAVAPSESTSTDGGAWTSKLSLSRAAGVARLLLGRGSAAGAWASGAREEAALEGLGLARQQTMVQRLTAWRRRSSAADEQVAAAVGSDRRATAVLSSVQPTAGLMAALRRRAASLAPVWDIINGVVLLYNWFVVSYGAALGPLLGELEDEFMAAWAVADAVADALTWLYFIRYLLVARDIELLAMDKAAAGRTKHNADFEAWLRAEREVPGGGGTAWWYWRELALRFAGCAPWQRILRAARVTSADGRLRAGGRLLTARLARSQLRALARLPRLLRAVPAYNKMVVALQGVVERALGPVSAYFCDLFLLGYALTHLVACTYLFLSSWEGWPDNSYGLSEQARGQGAAHAYFMALWWAWAAMTSGNVDEPVTTLEVSFTFLVSVAGLFLFAQLVNAVGQLTEASDVRAVRYRHRMDEVSAYCRTMNLPLRLRRRIFTYYNSLFERMGGFQSSMEQALGDLPAFMQTEVSMNLYARFLLKVGFVKAALACDEEQTMSFIKAVVGHLNPQLVLGGDTVVCKGDIGDEMFFIVSGSVSVVLDNGIVVATLGEGTNFGENACLFSERRTATVLATELCEVLTLRRDSVQPLLAQFPVVHACAQEVISQRREGLQRAETNAARGAR